MRNYYKGFSLVELLVVTAVMGILMAMLVPSVTSLLRSSNLTLAGQAVSDQINLARQMASTRSSTMEVRLIKLPDRNPAGFHAVQVWGTASDGTLKPVGRFSRLPESIFISDNTQTFSPMLSLLTNTSTLPGGPAGNAPYVSFRIRPTGTVVPSFSGSDKADLYLTLMAEQAGANTNNIITVQLNPDTAATTIYRPE